MNLLTDSLFTHGKTLTAEKYCNGKYKAGTFPIGKDMEVSDNSGVIAIWSESRRDSYGAYTCLYCLS